MLTDTRAAVAAKLSAVSQNPLTHKIISIGPDPEFPLQDAEKWVAEFWVYAGPEFLPVLESEFYDESFIVNNNHYYKSRPLYYKETWDGGVWNGFIFAIEVRFREVL